MPAPAFHSVDDYIAAQPESVRPVLQTVRKAIRQAAPEAEELISYNMPTYKIQGARLIYFAAWKTHYALYAATKEVVEKFAKELAPYKIEKGTIRFPLSKPVPVQLIQRVTAFRLSESKRQNPRPKQS